MPKRFDPLEIEAIGGPSPQKLRDWRHRGLLEDIGELRSGRWAYGMTDVLILGCAALLVEQGIEIAPAMELAKGGQGLLFAWLVAGSLHDNEMLADFRAQDEVVFVFHDDKARFKYSARRWKWEMLQASRDFRHVTSIFPQVVVGDLDQRFQHALLDEYESIVLKVRTGSSQGREKGDA